MATNKKIVKKAVTVKKTVPVKKVNNKNLDFENLDWIKEDTGTTWDFDSHPEFIGKFLRSEMKGGTGKDKKTGKKREAYTVNVFVTPDGSEVSLPNNYAIKTAIEKHGEGFYKIIFQSMKKMAQGRKVRVFEIFTA